MIKKYYNDAPQYCHYFFNLLQSDNIIDELKRSSVITTDCLNLLNENNENLRYKENKWSVKEVIKHIIDCERVYSYRSFRFSHFDATKLAGFDENFYIEKAKILEYSIHDLKEEYLAIRTSTIALFKGMSNEMLDFKGVANNVSFTARTLGFMTIGHNIHHIEFIKKMYLNLEQ